MTFTPTVVSISSITQSNPAVLSTNSDHNLYTGNVVRLRIPFYYGMQELNNKQLSVTILSSTTISLQYSQCPFINVDSRSFGAFTNLGTGTPAQLIPMGASATPVTQPGPLVTNGTCISNIDDALMNIATVNPPY
jgi:hypothetical protein